MTKNPFRNGRIKDGTNIPVFYSKEIKRHVSNYERELRERLKNKRQEN